MAHLLDAKLAADGVHDIVGCRTGGFVHEDGPIEGGEFLHGKFILRDDDFHVGGHMLKIAGISRENPVSTSASRMGYMQ